MRRKSPFENNPHQRVDFAVRGRVFTGQVESVDEENGLAYVRVDGMLEAKRAALPLGGLHYDGLSSSWQRYMPEPGAFVRLGYGPTNTLELVNYAAYGDEPDPADGAVARRQGGYATLARYARDNTNGMQVFRRLRSGEFDLRSRGGAGYYFDRHGNATIEAGPHALSLSKLRGELVADAPYVALGEVVRAGDVKRLLPGEAAERLAAANPASAPAAREFRVRVGARAAGGPEVLLYDDTAGCVRDDLGAPVLGGLGQPLRRLARYRDASGQVVATFSADVAGNLEFAQARATAQRAQVDLGTTEVTTQQLSVESQTSVAINAQTTADLGGLAVNLNAGGDADSAIVRGDALNLYLTTKLVVMTPFGPSSPALVPLAPGVELSLAAKVK